MFIALALLASLAGNPHAVPHPVARTLAWPTPVARCDPNTAGATRSAAAQPRIIVIPFTKEGESIRTVLESDFSRQLAIAKVKEAFDDRGFSTVDFLGVLRVVQRSAGMAMASEQDFRTQLLEASRADIYVVANFQPSQRGDGIMSVTVILDAYLTANGMSLGSRNARSRENRSTDTVAYVAQALDAVTGPLLDVMQQKFCEFQEEGVPFSVDVRVAEGAASHLQSDLPGQQGSISELLEEWIHSRAKNGGYSVANATRNLLQFTDVRLPLRDENDRAVSPTRFATTIRQYLRSIGVSSETSVSNGAIYVDIK